MVVSLQEVYTRNLRQLELGYPLWTPEPSVELIEHREDGLKIGDVGVVVPKNGSFDVFFNICLPREDPFHLAHGVPDNFTPIRASDRDIALCPNAECAGRIILSRSVKRVGGTKADTMPVDEDLSRSTTDFEISSKEGSVIILPDGAEHHYIRDTSTFEDMASRYGVEWYDFAKNRLGRLIPHNSLYLITGFYKTTSWSLASFYDAQGTSAQFTIKNVGGRDSYFWQSPCVNMEWRCGVASGSSRTPNQTVFIQGLNIELKTGFLGRRSILVTMDPPSLGYGRNESRIPIRAADDSTVGAGRAPRHQALDNVYNSNAIDLTDSITLDEETEIAEGAFAKIYKGTYHSHSGTLEVAIKVMKVYLIQNDNFHKIEKRLRREIRVWSVLHHGGVLRLIGTTMSKSSGQFPALVSPWAKNGTLTSYVKCTTLTEVDVQMLIHGVASGLHYLHSKGIVHGDLSGGNVLIDATGRALLADFGLSTVLEELGRSIFITSRTGKGTLRWAAPELLDLLPTDLEDSENPPRSPPMKESDVYSFGSIMLQILSGKIPYHYYGDNQVIGAIVRGVTPIRPKDCPHLTDYRWNFIQRCWSPYSAVELRPSSQDIVEFSDKMLP